MLLIILFKKGISKSCTVNKQSFFMFVNGMQTKINHFRSIVIYIWPYQKLYNQCAINQQSIL